MNKENSIYRLGEFIYRFQFVERQIVELIVLIAETDDEMVRVMINETSFLRMLGILDVMFTRFVNLKKLEEASLRESFHGLIEDIKELNTRRNALVHSNYWSWLNSEGKIGLLRKKSRLKTKNGEREEAVEKLMPEDFIKDLRNLDKLSQELHSYREKVSAILCPEDA